MPGPVVTTPPFGIQDSFQQRALGVLSSNTRVKGAKGMMGTALDQVLFAGIPSVYGVWTVPNTRVAIAGVPTVGASSQGLAFMIVNGAPVITGPMLASQTDPKITNT
ncbi:hypothetical protein [Nannocystis sp. SCPEA4]|uniref:hypothetical protein n=1 Tax=Nannocystis sp. SCPEA4 TaxID=2996787 RepID=UPI00226D9F08|nr:hypothetical protein [Nannocystis sp. SCPEA4]MCY1061719.1 hypothetical protein [Nannocystis sp. SCPEA4]